MSKAETIRAGRELFDNEEVQRLNTNPQWTAAELELACYVERPNLATLQDFAAYIRQMDWWDRG